MNKVITINLDGKAYQLEEAGYAALKKYLETAGKKLADDPDNEEILADFERAIAEKCDGYLKAGKNVVTEKEIEKTISDMGPVEASEESDDSKVVLDKQTNQPKRLYTLKDGAMIGGVANGLAAYFNIDVTIIRLLFVLLTFATSGAVILVYILMMLIVPEARTPEERAELRGQKFSAQDVMARAKQKYGDVSSKEHWQKVAENSKPALSNLGEGIQRLIRIICLLVGAGFGALLVPLTAALISVMWWLAFGHPQLTDQLSTISHLTIAAGLIAAFLVMALPIFVISGTFISLGSARQISKQSTRWLAGAAALWVAAIGVTVGVAAVTSGRISDYQSTHARIDIDHHDICINADMCNPEMPPKYVNPGGPVKPVFPPSYYVEPQ
jgi:phage shock protein PspC (stress-responsive transcriptional regulator)